jgi:hypothetical protein
MITSKRSVGGRTKHSFINSKGVLSVPVDPSAYQTWELSNANVIFKFIEDPLTGVRLKSWGTRDGTTTENRSRSLWAINTLIKYEIDYTTGIVTSSPRTVYPSFSTFQGATTSTSPEGNPVVTFTWDQVIYDYKHRDKTCEVNVIATLLQDTDTLDISIQIKLNGLFKSSDLQPFNSSVVHCIQFPSVVVQKSSTEVDNDNTVLSVPVAFGYTFHNPFKYLRHPRFNSESFQYSQSGERCFSAGFLDNIDGSLTRYNYSSPGGLTMPVVILGNKDNKEGTLYYALDQEGTNPKAFQYYFDDQSFHLKIAHMSDHQLDPYGVGGYTSDNGDIYARTNNPTWSFRIRPFSSRSRWVDWYGYKLYREEAVPEQMEWGWMPDSFYNRYRNNEISKAAAEIPAVLNLYGITTGTADAFSRAANIYVDLYKNSVSPALSDNVSLVAHYQTINLGAHPVRETNPADIFATYNGWEPWAAQGTGVGKVGPLVYRSPDYTGLNAKHAPAFAEMLSNRILAYSYCIFPPPVSTTSEWGVQYSGVDMAGKSIPQQDYTFTEADYLEWAYYGPTPGLYGIEFAPCHSIQELENKMVSNAADLSRAGMGMYHDTVGHWGRGCYAKGHRHLDDEGSVVTTTHPRGAVSKYFNDRQKQALTRMLVSAKQAHEDTWGNSTVPKGDLVMRQAAEHISDVGLGVVPVSLTYEPLGPIYNLYLNDIRSPREDAVANSYGDTPVDNIDDATLSGLVNFYGITHWKTLIDSPNWIQRCPGFQIVYSDRSILNEWSAVYGSNVYNIFFKNGIYSGIGAYGKVVTTLSGVDDVSAMAWASYAVQSWPYTNRVSCWHLDKQIEPRRPDFSGIENNENLIFYSGVWSGYTENLVKKLFRIQAYNPDYIYHGTFDLPLQTWSTDVKAEPINNTQLHKHKPTNTRDPYTYVRGNDTVQHTVRRHRAKDSLLLVAGNWYSGSTYFSGVFDPEYYGITTSYKVYELDVNTENHGTKTLLSGVPKLQPYVFNETFGKYDYLVLEFEADVPDPDVTDFAYVRYEYDTLGIQFNETTISYSYGSSVEPEVDLPMVGFKAPATQQILNNLPQWTKMRQAYTSNGWKLTNSWGMSMEYIIDNISKTLADFSLTTADISYFSKLNYTDITSSELLHNRTKRNLLYNSAFTIRDISRNNIAAGWTEHTRSGNVYLDHNLSAITPVGISSDTGTIRIGQQVLLNNIQVSSLVASVYLLCDQDDVDFTLFVSIENLNGTSRSYTARITNRSTEWRRLVLPMVVNSQVYRVNVSLLGSASGKMTVSAPQLELNSISSWTSSVSDYLMYMPSEVTFNSVHCISNEYNGPRIPLYPTDDEKTFINVDIPTRLVRIARPSRDLLEAASVSTSRKVDQLNQVTRTEYSVLEEQVAERALSPTPWDIFGRYDIRDLRLHSDLVYGTSDPSNVTITPLASAVRKGMLFVACKEEIKGEVYRTIKIMRPRTPPGEESYLESLTDFDLELDLDTVLDQDQITDEEIVSISFSEIDTSFMVITTTNNTKYYYRMYFDYYYFSKSKNRLYTIESYNAGNLVIL